MEIETAAEKGRYKQSDRSMLSFGYNPVHIRERGSPSRLKFSRPPAWVYSTEAGDMSFHRNCVIFRIATKVETNTFYPKLAILLFQFALCSLGQIEAKITSCRELGTT